MTFLGLSRASSVRIRSLFFESRDLSLDAMLGHGCLSGGQLRWQMLQNAFVSNASTSSLLHTWCVTDPKQLTGAHVRQSRLLVG